MATKKHYSKKSRNTRRKSSKKKKNKKTQKKQKGAGGKTVIPMNKIESQYRKMINLIKKDVALFSKSDEFLNKYFPNSKNSSDRNVIRQEGLVALAKIEQKFKTLMKVYANPSVIQSRGESVGSMFDGGSRKIRELRDMGKEVLVSTKDMNTELFVAIFIFFSIIFRMEGDIGIISSISGLISYFKDATMFILPFCILATGSYLMSYGGSRSFERTKKSVMLMKDKLLNDAGRKFDALNSSIESSGNIFDSSGRVIVFITNKSLVIAHSGKDIVLEKYKAYKELQHKLSIRNAMGMIDSKNSSKFSFNN